jgi:hypothetical protein
MKIRSKKKEYEMRYSFSYIEPYFRYKIQVMEGVREIGVLNISHLSQLIYSMKYDSYEKFCSNYGKHSEEYYNNWISFNLDKPFVTWVNVLESNRREGITEIMYVEMFRYMRKNGLYLYSSTNLSFEGIMFWEYMRKKYEVEKTEVERNIERKKEIRYCLKNC